MMRLVPLLGVVATVAVAPAAPRPDVAPPDEPVRARLELVDAGRASGTVTVAIRLTMRAGWHVYAREADGVGLPTTVRWRLPAGWTLREVRWPSPTRFDGPVPYAGHAGELVVLARIAPPASRGAAATPATVAADVRWAACADVCIPGRATLRLTLPPPTPAAAPAAPRVPGA